MATRNIMLLVLSIFVAHTEAVVSTVVPKSPFESLVLFDDFQTLNMSLWKHELTMSGEGNWEFEWYVNNRSVSRVVNGSLVIDPKYTASVLGEAAVENGFDANIWGGDPSTLCTMNEFYGCERTSGAGGNILNPIQSARIRTAESFSFRYGRVEVKLRLPRGDWLWPAVWMVRRNL